MEDRCFDYFFNIRTIDHQRIPLSYVVFGVLMKYWGLIESAGQQQCLWFQTGLFLCFVCLCFSTAVRCVCKPVCLCVCVVEYVCVSRGNGGRGVSFIGGSFNIFRLWSESQHSSAQCHKGDFDGKERGRKKWSGFGSKHWISFQAWTLHWAFQQMSKSLLAVDRQPNGPQQRECVRDMKEVETKG